MAITEPGVEEVERDIAELLRTEEIGSLAVVGPTGAPAVSMMHFASDGLAVYLHIFTYSRKHEAIARDPRVSYTIAAIPPDGFYGRGQLRAIQVEGIASFVTEPAEIPRDRGQPRTVRVDGGALSLYDDNRVRLLWRKIITFTQHGRHVAELSPYETKLKGTATADGDRSAVT
jgi:Pyridoxamine 5'-phosphate oxidase